MPDKKAKTTTFFCDNCGETKTYRVDDGRIRKSQCDNCLTGNMIEAVHTMEPDGA